MKNFKLILFFSLMLMFILTSCEGKLDERDGIYNSEGTDYTNMDKMIEPMLGNYERISSRGWEDFPLLAVRGDDVNAGGLGDQQDYAETDKFNYNKDYWMYNSVWQNMHKDMAEINANINEILKYKENASGSDITRANQYVAESKVLRAWLQFQLSRTLG
jgi:hypothetical protein